MNFEAPERRPNVVYLDEDEVNSDLIYDRQGEMVEVIERESKEKQVGGEGGAGGSIPGIGSLRAAINAHWTKGEESEFVTNLDHPAAKLALFLESLAENNSGTVLPEDFDETDREDLEEGDVILIDGGLRRTPFSDLRDRFDMGDSIEDIKKAHSEFRKMGEMIGKDTTEIEEAEKEIEAMESGLKGLKLMAGAFAVEEDLYRVRATESDIDFVMDLNKNKFENRPFGFPDSRGSYRVVGKVQKKFRTDQDIQLIRFAELVDTDNPRTQKREEAQKRVEIKDLAKKHVNDREIENSEFDISYPDIQIHPLVIYK